MHYHSLVHPTGPGDYDPKSPGGTSGGAFFVKSGRFEENAGNPELGPGKYFDADGNEITSQMDIDSTNSHGVSYSTAFVV